MNHTTTKHLDGGAVRPLVIVALVLALLVWAPGGSNGSNADAANDYSTRLISNPSQIHLSSGVITASRNWIPDEVDSWIAYDLSSVTITQRQQLMVSIQAPVLLFHQPTTPLVRTATDFVIETHNAAGGTPPIDGWRVIDSVSNNTIRHQQRLVDNNGANWLRIRVFGASDETFQMISDVYSIEGAPDDDWLFVGDSLTVELTPDGVAAAAREVDPTRAAIMMNAAIGGANTLDGLDMFRTALPTFPGRYVVVALGTNDVPNQFNMAAIIDEVLAAGLIPVVPLAPWAPDAGTRGVIETNNDQIRDLYNEYPEIIVGPDFFAALQGRSELYRTDNVHPNDDGIAVQMEIWGQFMASIDAPAGSTGPTMGPLDTIDDLAGNNGLQTARRT